MQRANMEAMNAARNANVATNHRIDVLAAMIRGEQGPTAVLVRWLIDSVPEPQE
jgi:hypothetical protein